MMKEDKSSEFTDYEYLAVRDHALPLIGATIGGLISAENSTPLSTQHNPRLPS